MIFLASGGGFEWPSADQWLRLVLLRDYNTRVVLFGVTLLGAASGLIGSFMLLRKRALLGDALSHAMLPGLGAAFLLMTALGGDGKWLPGLLAGATIAGAIGILTVLAIVHSSRIREDAALGIVLSVFFGAGVALTSVAQSSQSGSAAGLEAFIYGKTASMLLSDAVGIAVAAAAVLLASLALLKEFRLLCFDPAYAATQGWPVLALDTLMMAVVVLVTVIGLQAVGLILMIALLVIPAAAARFWTQRLSRMLIAAALIGAASAGVGAALSALLPRLPAGAVIVLVAGAAFGVSVLCGPIGGLLPRAMQAARLESRIHRQHLLRAMYEIGEIAATDSEAAQRVPVSFTQLLAARSWRPERLRAVLRAARRDRLIEEMRGGWRLTELGGDAAWRTARNHRLWELFLISHADVAPTHVDRDADEVEHVLDAPMIVELEAQLATDHPDLMRPPSPHRLALERG